MKSRLFIRSSDGRVDHDWLEHYLPETPYELRRYRAMDIVKTDQKDIVFSIYPSRGKALINLCSRTKAYALKSQREGTQVKVDMNYKPTYGHVQEIPKDMEVSEIDLRSAYLSAAVILKIIPAYWGDRLLKIKDKETRLSIIGMLGSRYNRQIWDPKTGYGKLEGPFIAETAPSLRKIHIWVDQHMHLVSKLVAPGFKWFWVDGIFVEPKYEKKVVEYFDEQLLRSKVTKKYVLEEAGKIKVLDKSGTFKDYTHLKKPEGFVYSVVESGMGSKTVLVKDLWVEDAKKHATRLANKSGLGWAYEVVGPSGPIMRFPGKERVRYK